MYENALTYAPQWLGWKSEKEIGGKGGLSDWSLIMHANYDYPPSYRPLYKVPMTSGFADMCNDAWASFEANYKKGRAITTKKCLIITSAGDDVLATQETLVNSSWIGPHRQQIEMAMGSHDVFLSNDPGDTQQALAHVQLFLQHNFP